MTLQFFAIHSDIGAGKYGTTKGVTALAKHCQDKYNASVFDIIPTYQQQAPIYPKAKHIETLTAFFKDTLVPTLSNQLSTCQQQGNFPIIISGDHSNAMGSVASFINANANKKIGVVWIDAHADLHSVYTTPSGNLHGTPVATVIGENNEACQINEVEQVVAEYWQTLTALSSNLAPTDIHFLGVRDTEQPEEYLIEKYGIFCHSATNHRTHGFERVLDELLAKLAQYETVYVSFDIDSLDKSLVPATGTPVGDGYTLDEMEAIFTKLLAMPNIGAFEITEFNPTLENGNTTYQNVVAVFDRAISILIH